jgi:tetratricopeptide (TPR) repeat protein
MDNQKHTFYRLIILTILTFSNLHALQCFAQDGMKGPFKKKPINHFEKYGEGQNTFLNFYQKWISPVKGGNKCPMYPSCSQYAKIAFKVLPWYEAYTKSLERLLRCGRELYLYPAVQINDNIRWHDPVFIKELKHVSNVPKDNLKSVLSYKNVKYRNPYVQDSYDEGFADYLFKRGEYYRAITEYYRLLYVSTDSTKITKLCRNLGLCYFYGGDYEGYISFLENNKIRFRSNAIIRAEMELYLGKSYYYLKQYQKVITTLEWSNVSSNNRFFDERQFLLGISYARIFDWQAAVQKMQLIRQDSPRKITAENFSNSLKDFSDLPKKSPIWAGTFSAIIPGAGYFYCNRKRTGITSFIVNGLFIWIIRDAIVQKQYGIATAAGFFGIGWYIGNIKGSIDAANIYNTNIRNEFIDRSLEKENLYEYLINAK